VRTYFASADHVVDPLSACAAVFSDGYETVAFLSLDVVIVEWEYVQRIRDGVSRRRGIPAQNILVCATHNHACAAAFERKGGHETTWALWSKMEEGAGRRPSICSSRK